jgi:hypothetical protein
MPGFLVTSGTTLICAHGGSATTPVVAPRVRIGGLPVVTMVAPMVVAGCASPPPPAGVGPCVSAVWVTSASRVRVQGVAVVCSDSLSIATPTGTPLAVVATQSRVRAK